MSKNDQSIAERGARYKLYQHTLASRLLSHHRWLACAYGHFSRGVDIEHADLGMSARRAAEQRASRLRCRIDHAGWLIDRRRAQEERFQLQVQTSAATALKRPSDFLGSGVPAIRQRLVRLPSDLDGYMARWPEHVPVQEPMVEVQEHARTRDIE